MRCSRIEEADSDAGQPAGTVFRIGQGGKARTRKVECPGFSRHPGASQNSRPQITIKPMTDIKLFALEKGSAKEVHGRGRLPEICSVPKVLKKFANRAHDLEEAHEGAVAAGADSTPYKKLSTFRQWLTKPEVATAPGRTQGETRKKIEFELNKLAVRLETVRGKLKSKN